ncbi:MAG: hypothetical protein HY744_17085 [Deltaproteobacteria bacterium]|nr:hypothetical protein [Deltaproteobacteria bacterium]
MFAQDAQRKTGLTLVEVCAHFTGAKPAKVRQHRDSLVSLGLLARYEAAGTAHWHAP